MHMQTIDSYVFCSTMDAPWRPRRQRAQWLAASLSVAIAVAAGLAALWLAVDSSTTARRPKADARIFAESPIRLPSDDDAKIAAFQEAAAMAHLTLAAPATGADELQTAGPVSKPTSPLLRKPAQKPAPKSVLVAPPVPQAHPAAPEVILADLPAAAKVDAAPADGQPQLFGRITQGVESVPSEVQDFARGMTDRLFGALANVGARVGL
jgi:hypothetical protein